MGGLRYSNNLPANYTQSNLKPHIHRMHQFHSSKENPFKGKFNKIQCRHEAVNENIKGA